MPQSNYTNDLQTLRLLLSEQTPGIKVQPVSDIGQGISVGVNNIIGAIQQRQQSQKLAQLLAQQQLQAQEIYNQKVAALESLGLDSAGAKAGAYDEELARQLQKQTYDSSVADRKDAQDLSTFQSIYDGYKAKGYSTADAQIAAISAVYGQRSPVGADTLVNQGNGETNLSNPIIAQIIKEAQTRQPSTLEQALLNNYGIKFDPLYTRLEQAANIAKGNADAQIKGYEAQIAPNQLTANLQALQLANQGRGLDNQLKQNTFERDEALMAQQMATLNGDVTIPTFSLTSGILSPNPAQTLNSLIGHDRMFDKRGGLEIPKKTPPQPVQTTQQEPTEMGRSFYTPSIVDSFNPNLRIAPMQRGQLFRKELFGTIGNGVNTLGTSISQGFKQANEFDINLGKGVQGFLGLPMNPFDPDGHKEKVNKFFFGQ